MSKSAQVLDLCKGNINLYEIQISILCHFLPHRKHNAIEGTKEDNSSSKLQWAHWEWKQEVM